MQQRFKFEFRLLLLLWVGTMTYTPSLFTVTLYHRNLQYAVQESLWLRIYIGEHSF